MNRDSDSPSRDAAAPAAGTADHSAQGDAAHPSTRLYIAVAVILAALTALEVMVFYIEALAPVLVPILLAMMVAKFALVAMFFMHLKSDEPILTGVFAWGLFIATGITVGIMAMFGKFGS